jgi:hypothetical protein
MNIRYGYRIDPTGCSRFRIWASDTRKILSRIFNVESKYLKEWDEWKKLHEATIALADGGVPVPEISRRLGVNYYTVWDWVNRRRSIKPRKYNAKIDFTRNVIKRIPRYFLENANSRQLTILWETLMKGDGSVGRILVTVSKELLDDYQELATKIGLRNIAYLNKDGYYHLHTTRRMYAHVGIVDSIKTVPYKGKVWCVTTENGFVVVRRNYRVCISGNSYVLLSDAPLTWDYSRAKCWMRIKANVIECEFAGQSTYAIDSEFTSKGYHGLRAYQSPSEWYSYRLRRWG